MSIVHTDSVTHFPLRSVTCLFALAVISVACGGDDSSSNASSTATAAAIATSTAVATLATEPLSATTAPDLAVASTSPRVTSDPVGAAVTILHAFGETTVDGQPERIVALGVAETDALLELGITPVGAVALPAVPEGTAPWWANRLDTESTTLLEPDAAGAFEPEEIAALQPDLIIAMTAFVDDNSYEILSRIAPTVPYLVTPFADSWQDVTTTVGTAIGHRAAAAAMIAELETNLASVEETLPDGLTYSFNVVPAPSTVVSVTDPADPANQFLGDLGMEVAPALRELPRDPNLGAIISVEQIELLDADVVLMFYVSTEANSSITENALFAHMAATVDGRVIELDPMQATAVRAPTVLAIPWLIDQLVPSFESATR